MGDTLSKPVETKDTTEKVLPQHDLIYVSSSMQGWRTDMEDVSTVVLGFQITVLRWTPEIKLQIYW